jgi:glycosyltransferase involved in cell wall biosynthesis
MQIDNFTISVIVPSYNAEKYLSEALKSILIQTCPVAEIIVVDDGSTDRTREIVEKFSGVRYVYQENAGVAAALNRGCLMSSGTHISFISADDVWRPDKLLQQKEQLLKSPNAIVFGHMMNFISPDLAPSEALKIACPKAPMPAFSAGTLLTRLDTFNQIGPFNEVFNIGEFVDWFGRAKDLQIEVIMIDAVVSLRRLHMTNHSKTAINSKSYAPVLKAILDRRRAKESFE